MKPLVTAALLIAAAAFAQDKVNQAALVQQDFAKRVADYVKMRDVAKAEIHGLKPTSSTEAIEHYERRFAHSLREARRTARQGDLFTPEIAAEFRRLIGISMQGPEGARIRESLRSAQPVSLKEIQVNGAYPHGIPLQSAPPSLLANLPVLPKDLEYRVVGRSLILRDQEANLIIDFLPNAIP